MSIFAKLMAARKDFHSASIVKTGYNKFSEYSYFELSDFLLPALAILADYDLVPIISFTDDLATMTVHDVETGETFVITSALSTAALKACQPVQSMGACQTFVRRYLYVTLMEIVEHDVLEETSTENPDGAPAAMATDKQMVTINEYLESDDTPDVTKAFIRKHLPFTEEKADAVIKQLK